MPMTVCRLQHRGAKRQSSPVENFAQQLLAGTAVLSGGLATPGGPSHSRPWCCSNFPFEQGRCQDSNMFQDDERQQYAARQYESLREELAQARQSQQSILQWSQAVSGTLFAAALVAGTAHPSRYAVAAQFVFGLVLPAVLIGGALTWSGELIRLTRIGVFLRSFERASWAERKPNQTSATLEPVAATSLFIWQNFAWSPPRRFMDAGFRGKQNVGYTGIAVFFGVMYLGSVVVFCTISAWPLALTVSILLVVIGALVMVPPALQLFKLNRAPLNLTASDLTEWLDNIEAGKGAPSQRHIWLRAAPLLGVVKNLLRSQR